MRDKIVIMEKGAYKNCKGHQLKKKKKRIINKFEEEKNG